jgi:hypothetical protein
VIVIMILVISFNFIFGRGLHILGYEYIFRIVLGWGFFAGFVAYYYVINFFPCYNVGGGGVSREGG